jgi:hypothetical protein
VGIEYCDAKTGGFERAEIMAFGALEEIYCRDVT